MRSFTIKFGLFLDSESGNKRLFPASPSIDIRKNCPANGKVVVLIVLSTISSQRLRAHTQLYELMVIII